MIPITGWTQDSEHCVQCMPPSTICLIKEEFFCHCLAIILSPHPRTVMLDYFRMDQDSSVSKIPLAFFTFLQRFNILFLWVSTAFHVCNINHIHYFFTWHFYVLKLCMIYLANCKICEGRSTYTNLWIFETEQTQCIRQSKLKDRMDLTKS